MAQTKIVFAEWLPDQPGVTGALTEAKNCIPVTNGYEPMQSEADLSGNAGQTLLTVFAGKYAQVSTLFAAGASQIFKYNNSTRALAAMTTTGYTDVVSWDVVQFGSVMLAANGLDKIQAVELNTSNFFDDVAAAAPIAKYITVVRDFVVAANETSFENKVYWSDINDETNWTPGATSQSDSQVIADGGDIMGLAGGEYGLVLLEKAIYRMSYIGSPLFFQFDAISRGIGCLSNGSVVQYNGLTYFLANDGFYVSDGQTVKSISAGKVDKWFFDNADPNSFNLMSSSVDPVKRLIAWCFSNVFASKLILIYSIDTGKWSYVETTASAISIAITPPVTLEGLDLYSTSIDALPVSLDARQWAGGDPLFAGVSGQKIITFGGANKTASIVTGDIDIGRSVITLARPLVDGGSASVAVSARANLSDAISYTTPVAADTEGRASLRSAGRYMRVQTIPSGSWSTCVGVDVDITKQGGR
jgi:hypothetical protein